jgi:predicted nucleic acid-binding Zn ribbon protein
MAFADRRKNPRFKTEDLISYVCIDDNGSPIKEGKGKAINVSKGGILIESVDAFKWQDILLLTVDAKRKSFPVKGRVVYSNTDGSELFQTGVEFLETGDVVLTGEMTIEPWKCPGCGRKNDGLSTRCIRCGFTDEAFVQVQKKLAAESIEQGRKRQKNLILSYVFTIVGIIVVGTFLYWIGVLPRLE